MKNSLILLAVFLSISCFGSTSEAINLTDDTIIGIEQNREEVPLIIKVPRGNSFWERFRANSDFRFILGLGAGADEINNRDLSYITFEAGLEHLYHFNSKWGLVTEVNARCCLLFRRQSR